MKKWTQIQKSRLVELNAKALDLSQEFAHEKLRNQTFQKLENALVNAQKLELLKTRNNLQRPRLCTLSDQLVDVLTSKGFVQVTTITSIPASVASCKLVSSHPQKINKQYKHLFEHLFFIQYF